MKQQVETPNLSLLITQAKVKSIKVTYNRAGEVTEIFSEIVLLVGATEFTDVYIASYYPKDNYRHINISAEVKKIASELLREIKKESLINLSKVSNLLTTEEGEEDAQ